jgi:hypothetical protein
MKKTPLPATPSYEEISAASGKQLARFISQYHAGAKTELAKLVIDARISRRLLCVTWMLFVATVVLVVATLFLLKQAT